MGDRMKVCICGGGNGAHVMACLSSASQQKPEVRVLTLFKDEAARWAEKLKEEGMTVTKHNPDGKTEEIKGTPALVTKDACKAVTGADVIIFCVPAFAHQQYLEAIAQYVAPNTSIIGVPGQPGFEFQCFHLLEKKAKSCVILNYETLPWACRISEFGRKVDMLGVKETVTGSRVSGRGNQPKFGDPAKILQSFLGALPVLCEANNYLELTLMAMSFCHPPIMYGKWKDWDEKPLSEEPLFYQGASEEAVNLLSAVSDEVLKIGAKIAEIKPDVKMNKLEHAEKWLKDNYVTSITDSSSFYKAMRTNASYNGLVHPMKNISPGQYMPDFRHRYLSEDIPFGLTIVKGMAQILGLGTPIIDEVMTWAQGKLGKEYLVGSELKGKDVKETRAPQAFGFHSLDDLVGIM
ncbi:opine dehydrogenase-like [Babylonia areolata]|uniref:opine dehydrogenase-like n=1 Tax=Babylonia areolata TaxID=304850 RepID=UPI003FD6A44E